MSAPAWGSTGTLFGASGSNPALAVPASVGADDVIVVGAYIDSTATVTAFASGFQHAPNSPRTVAPGGGGGEHSLVVMWKRATGADSGTYAFTLSASVFVFGNAIRYTGCISSGDPWDATNAAQSGPVNVNTAPAVSLATLGPDRMLFYVATDFNGDGGTWSAPAGFNLRQGGTNVTTHEIADLVQTAAGSTGSLSGSNTLAGYMGAWLGALIGTTAGAAEANVPRPTPPLWVINLFGARRQRMFDLTPGTPPTVETGTAVLALIGTGAAVKVARQAGTAILALTGQGAARRTAVEAGTAVLALTGTAAGRKVAPAAGRALLALTGTGVESTVTTRAQAGTALLALTGTSAARKTASTVNGRALLALVGTGGALHRAVAAGTALAALTGTGTARKTATGAGRAVLALIGTGVESTGSARPQSGTALLVLSGVGAARRLARPAGTATLALVGAGTARHVTPAAGRAVLALRGASAAGHVAMAGGRALLALLAYEVVPLPTNPPGADFTSTTSRPLLAMLGADSSGILSSTSTTPARMSGDSSSGGPGAGRDRPSW